MIHFACYSSVNWAKFTCDCSLSSYDISQAEILSQTTSRTWWKYIDVFCPTFVCSPYSSSFPLYWPSSTPREPFSLTSVLAKSIRHKSVWGSYPAAQGFVDHQCHCQALSPIHCLPPSHLAVIWIIQVPIPVKATFGIRNAFKCTISFTFRLIAVDSFDSVHVQYLSLSSREVLCRQSWWHSWSIRQFNCSRTIMLNVWPVLLGDLSSIWNLSYGCHLLVLSAGLLLCST